MQTLIATVPTGAIYGIHAAQETRAEELATIDVGGLVGALRRDPVVPTAVTPQHERLVDPRSPFDVIAFTGGGAMVFVEFKVFDPTPSVIEQARGATVAIRREPVSEPAAYEAFKALGRWLDADDAAIADMVGVGRTTPYTWKRDGREPRAATSQRIYEHHATLDSLRRRLGAGGLRRWLHEGIPPRRETLLAGGLERLDADVHALLFRREPARRIDLAAAPEDTAPVAATRDERSLRPSGRRPRRSGG
jgi:hypothetical protein